MKHFFKLKLNFQQIIRNQLTNKFIDVELRESLDFIERDYKKLLANQGKDSQHENNDQSIIKHYDRMRNEVVPVLDSISMNSSTRRLHDDEQHSNAAASTIVTDITGCDNRLPTCYKYYRLLRTNYLSI